MPKHKRDCLKKRDGSTPSMKEVAGALLDTVNVRLIDKPRGRRRH